MPFIILSSQRCGSNLIMSALNSHRNIVCEDELFRTPIWKEKKEINDKIRFLFEICNNEKNKTIEIFNEIPYLDNEKNNDLLIYGFMIKYNQLELMDQKIVEYILKNFQIIHLKREDVVRRGIGHVLVYLSLKKKINLKLHFQKEEEPEHILFDDFLMRKVKNYIVREEALIKKYSLLLKDKLVFNLLYEDLTNNSNVNIINYNISNSLCEFLNVSIVELKPTIIKNEKASPKNIISNYNDVINYLKKEFSNSSYDNINKILKELY